MQKKKVLQGKKIADGSRNLYHPSKGHTSTCNAETHAETKGIFYALFVVCSRIQVRQASPAPKLVDKWSESCLQPLAFSLSSNTIRATTKAVLCRESKKKNEWKSVFLQSHPHSWRCFRSLLQITNRIQVSHLFYIYIYIQIYRLRKSVGTTTIPENHNRKLKLKVN